MKRLFIAEKPSVGTEFANIIGKNLKKKNGYIEDSENIFTWCVGHLVKMSYPEVYDINLKKWDLSHLPFIPEKFKYEVIKNVEKQFNIIKDIILSGNITTIYVCTDSGREGEYIYRLVEEMIGIQNIKRYRVWIDSQTEEEILRGVKEAKDLSYYDNLSDSAYLRAKEDYLMGINFSRLLTLKFSNKLSDKNSKKWIPISIGRVMSCVLGMIVQREREIRNFQKKEYFKVIAGLKKEDALFNAEWHWCDGSHFKKFQTYKDIGFNDEDTAKKCIDLLRDKAVVKNVEKKKETKKPPFLYNLAELQNECSKSFKIPPNKTLEYAQQLYEKKLITYPRTDAKVLSTAIAKEIHKNLNGLVDFPKYGIFAKNIIDMELYKGFEKTKYVDDRKVTDHYAIIPTGQGIKNFFSLDEMGKKIYGKILIRFLSVMYSPAKYESIKISFDIDGELFNVSDKVLTKKGYLEIAGLSKNDKEMPLPNIKKNDIFDVLDKDIKPQETSPPQRYNTGSIILAMENAGSLIEDEELRLQIKGSGIGTSATRAEIINKLSKNEYISINTKTQIIKPTLIGESIFHIIENTIPALLNPMLTASWEKGLTMVANGEISKEIYMDKLNNFVNSKVRLVKKLDSVYTIVKGFDTFSSYYD